MTNDLDQFGRTTGLHEYGDEAIFEMAKFAKGVAEALVAVNDSLKLAVVPSEAVAVQTQFVVQTMPSSYFPDTVPLSQSPPADMSSAELLHAQVQR